MRALAQRKMILIQKLQFDWVNAISPLLNRRLLKLLIIKVS